MMSKIRAAIVGSTGYGGVELIRILLRHPQVEITSVISSSTAGAPIADGFPHLNQILTDALDGIDIGLMKEKADVVFLATPAGVASNLAPQIVDAGLKVIDLSGDYRLPAEVYQPWYDHEPAPQDYYKQAVYGLAEVFGEEVKGKALISNPGCYATATTLGLVPAVAEGWIDPNSIIVDAKSGVSGAGRKVGLLYHYSEMNENFLAYKINKHQHTPEIEQVLSRVSGGAPVTITFTPHLVPMTRGILCTMYATLTQPRTEEEVIGLYRKYYEGREFVRIREKGKYPATKEVTGSNYCDIGFSVDERTGRLTIVSVIDNVMKGAAGQAVQNLNLMMGWNETTGLEFTPVYP
ncbi:N-acetyl-gamma-glutamyl-phosphate reductase [Paenibacillus sp. y28]|uniref:N-acetyl-gamma-glutamyl-phosphate reductase n=1 Tax=Paenibacillus sp. y28 TaxID=3129110 RepID=UPI003015C1A4